MMMIVRYGPAPPIAATLFLVAWLLAGSSTIAAAPGESQADTVALPPPQVRTVSQSKCGGAELSTPGTTCQGFDAREVRSQSDLWVVGFENNAEINEKHILQTVASFDLAPLHGLPQKAKITNATLTYFEASTTRRSASGDSEYGVLATCNTRLGVGPSGWDGNPDRLVAAGDAAIAGVQPATTAEAGSWNVTPQLEQWHRGHASRGIFVLRGDDESLDVRGQSLCVSYIFDVNLSVEYSVLQ